MTKAGKPKVLVFHIGDHKTGTTSIQNAFAAGCVTLPGLKLSYPTPLNHNYLHRHIVAFRDGKPTPKTQGRQRTLQALSEEIAASDAAYTVISGEVFENVPAPLFHEIVEKFFRAHVDEVRIVAYVRPHAQRLLSSYAEQIKIGWFRGSMAQFFEETLVSERFFYAPRFSSWRDAFGEDFTLRPMIRSELLQGSALQDFATTAFAGETYEVADFIEENQSLDLRELALLRFLQGQYQDKGKWLRHTLGWELARLIGQQARSPAFQGLMKSPRLGMDRDLAARVAEAYQADAEAMDQSFFEGRPLLQQSLQEMRTKAVDSPQSLEAEDHFSIEELRNLTVLAQLVHDMLKVKHPWAAYLHKHRIRDVAAMRPEK